MTSSWNKNSDDKDTDAPQEIHFQMAKEVQVGYNDTLNDNRLNNVCWFVQERCKSISVILDGRQKKLFVKGIIAPFRKRHQH